MIRVSISGYIHDEARVVSAKFYLVPSGGLALLRNRVSDQLDITNKWAEENGAFIGHVKAYIQWGENEAIMLSTTGDGTEAKGSDIPVKTPNIADIGVTAIVFGIELEAAIERLKGLAAAVVGQYMEYCVYERIHEHEHRHIDDDSHESEHQHSGDRH